MNEDKWKLINHDKGEGKKIGNVNRNTQKMGKIEIEMNAKALKGIEINYNER